jgi:hypothetical protein
MTRQPLPPHVLRDLIAKCVGDVSDAVTRTATLAATADDLMTIALSGGIGGASTSIISALTVVCEVDREVAEKVVGLIFFAQGLIALGREPGRVTARVDRVMRRVAGDELTDRLKLEFV